MYIFASIPVIIYVFVILFLLYNELIFRKTHGRPSARDTALGRSYFGAIVIAMTLIGSNLGPADTIGLSEEGAKYGFFFLIFPFFAGLQHIIAGKFFAHKIAFQSGDCITMGDKMKHSITKSTRVIVGIITVLQALAFTGILTLAGGQVLESLYNVPITIGVLITAIFVAIYSYAGGMNAIIKTDVVQFWIIVGVAIIAIVTATLIIINNINVIEGHIFWQPGGGDFTPKSLIALVIAYFLGEAFLPMYTIRAYISKKPRDASRAFTIFGIAIILYYAIMIYIGVSSNLVKDDAFISEIVLVKVISSLTGIIWLKWILAGLAFTALLSLTHSTLDSVLNAGASALAIDILKPFIEFTNAQLEKQIKNGLILIALFGTVFSLVSDNLIEILLIGYTIWVPTVVFPFAYIIMKQNKVRSNYSTIWGITGGVIGYFAAEIFLNELWIPSILIGFISNASMFLLCELASIGKKKVAIN